MAISRKTPEQVSAESTSNNTSSSSSVSPTDSISGRKWKYYSKPVGSLSDLNFVDLNKIKKQAIILLIGDDGSGKCLGFGTPILMYDGSIKPVEEVVVGDMLMGPDSLPRTVLSLGRGRDKMYRIIPKKGDSWVCNSAHILTLINSADNKIHDIPISDYLHARSQSRMRDMLLLRSPVEFASQDTALSPYVMGVWLGDGHRGYPIVTTSKKEIIEELVLEADRLGINIKERVDKRCNTSQWSFTAGSRGGDTRSRKINPVLVEVRRAVQGEFKTIPNEYLYNSRKVRLQVLAGLLDTDGYVTRGCYEIITKSPYLRDQIKFLCRSLGLAAYHKVKIGKINGIEVGTYYRLMISGHTSEIPCRVSSKKAPHRKSPKDVLRVGFSVEFVGEDNYYGFEISGDGRFLLGDTTVTHNTSFATRYAPDPLVVVSFDGRSRQAVKEAKEMGRKVDLIEISVTHKSLPPDQMKLHAREVVERSMYTYETLIEESKKGNVRSILFPDTATEYNEILKLAYDGTIEITKEGAKGTDKDFIARQWWRIFNLARNDSNAHLIVTSRMTEIWKDDKPTGAFKAKCSRAVSSGVDLTMQIRLKTTFGVPKPEFEILVTNPKTNIVELGNVYDAKMWDKFGGPFVYSCLMNYPDSEMEEWQ
jgi:hypothetical protein